MKIALVHDHLNQPGGAERVLERLHVMYPQAPIYTAILDRDSLWPGLKGADYRVSWMKYLPGVNQHHKVYLPCYPVAFHGLDLREYDLVISSSSAFAKAVRTRPDASHICYCHTPMRFVWDYDRYVERENLGTVVHLGLPPLIRMLKHWDVATARRPDLFVANSSVVAERIKSYYGRPSEIVHPPVCADRFTPTSHVGDFYLVVSRLVSYKRVDLAVAAFTEMNRPLLVIGTGPDRAALGRIAGPTIKFLGHQPDDRVAEYYAQARGLIFPGEEDFGITPLESNASGRPVIAYARGGALDTVTDNHNGILFPEQTVRSLCLAVERAERRQWDSGILRQHAEKFGEPVFAERMAEVVETELRRKSDRIGQNGVLRNSPSDAKLAAVRSANGWA